MALTADELAQRKASWHSRENDYGSGALWKYAKTVGTARFGAVTHGGARAEKISYDKI